MSEDQGATTLTAQDDTGGDGDQTENQTTQSNESDDSDSQEQSGSEEQETGDPQGAPEEYTDFSIPDGMELDPDALKSFTPIARELNLTQAQAQQLVDVYAAQLTALQSAQAEAVAEVRKGWVEGIKTDTEIGGSALAENVGLAVKALDRFGTPELRKALEESGLGDHPEMVRVFYRIGKAIAEDTIDGGQDTPAGSEQKSHAQILYPDQGE